MSETLEFYSMNTRGLQTKEKRKEVFTWLKKYKNQIIMLQETHSTKLDEVVWERDWNTSIIFSHGTSASRGVCIMLPKYLQEHCEVIYKDVSGRILIIKIEINENVFYVGNIYAPTRNRKQNEQSQMDFICELFEALKPFENECLIMGGDWNTVLDQPLDKKGGKTKTNNHNYNVQIASLQETFDLTECWRVLHPNKRQFTWF